LSALRVLLGPAIVALFATAAAMSAAAQRMDERARMLSALAEPRTPDPVLGKFIGAGSCSAVACHGGIQPRSLTKVMQNEYSTWVTEDKHARAYTVLTQPLAEQMAVILKIGRPETAQKCVTCHALPSDIAHRARDYDLGDGVSCESCHGPASGWLEKHIEPTARHADLVGLGLWDNKDLAKRSERCLTCHLGAPGMSVDHEMIAAGHPDLGFELDSYTAVEPPHWIEKAPDQKEALSDPLFGVRAWGIGQAVQLRESMRRVARRAQNGPWPEFSEMECMACHHSLTGPLSWRQKAGYSDRRAGDAPYNLARYVVFRYLAEDVDGALNQQLRNEVGQVALMMTSMSADRSAIMTAANRASALADRMVSEIQSMKYDRTRTLILMRRIAGDADAISAQGERAAEQATMALDSLYIADAKAGMPSPETRAAIDAMFKQVNNPSAYNAPQFAIQMKRVGMSLH
jgi:Cytochrome c554 and c-prime